MKAPRLAALLCATALLSGGACAQVPPVVQQVPPSVVIAPPPQVQPSVAPSAPSADATTARLTDAYGRVHRVSAAIAQGCTELRQWLLWINYVPYGNYIGPGIQIACNTAEGIERLSADSSAPLWLGTQIGIFKSIFKH